MILSAIHSHWDEAKVSKTEQGTLASVVREVTATSGHKIFQPASSTCTLLAKLRCARLRQHSNQVNSAHTAEFLQHRRHIPQPRHPASLCAKEPESFNKPQHIPLAQLTSPGPHQLH